MAIVGEYIYLSWRMLLMQITGILYTVILWQCLVFHCFSGCKCLGWVSKNGIPILNKTKEIAFLQTRKFSELMKHFSAYQMLKEEHQWSNNLKQPIGSHLSVY